ncbi:MAG: L,D-transpeptidase family protein [Bdellovibrionota bacterium]
MGLNKTILLSVLMVSMGFSIVGHASTESDRVQAILQSKMYLRAGDAVFETAPLNKLYMLRGFESIWFKDMNLTPAAYELKAMFLNAGRHGLKPTDYWTPALENLFKAPTAQNWITLELMASEAYVRYASNIATGRLLAPAVTPEEKNGRYQSNPIDDKLKFKSTDFADYDLLNRAVSNGMNLTQQIDEVAPQHYLYKRMVSMLAKLRQIQADKVWGNIDYDGKALKVGDSSPLVPVVKRRLTLLGYYVSNESTIYDEEMKRAVLRYRDINKLKLTSEIGQSFFDRLTVPLTSRIEQLEVNLEKLRWLGRSLDAKHVFVNTGFQEAKVIENEQIMIAMRTVNGQVMRRTPMMKDAITYVDVNPTWGIPDSIFFKNKVPLLQKDPNYLTAHNMKLFTFNSVTGQQDMEVDPTTVNWMEITTQAQAAKYFVVQGPGIDNALGVIKFPLQNRWAIYLHDTNERNLFGENDFSSSRLISSGCIRLEKPMELATYLLKDQPNWTRQVLESKVPSKEVLARIARQPIYDSWSRQYIDPYTGYPVNPNTIQPIPTFENKAVILTKAVPVYIIYLTADVTETGEIRFVDDVYGLDARMKQILAGARPAGEKF